MQTFIFSIAFCLGVIIRLLLAIKLPIKAKLLAGYGVFVLLFLFISFLVPLSSFPDFKAIFDGFGFSAIFFVFLVALFFNKALRPKVNEGTLLLYGYLAFYITLELSNYSISTLSSEMLPFLLVLGPYLLGAMYMCVTKQAVPKWFQSTMLFIFVLMSALMVGLSFTSLWGEVESFVTILLFGFFSLHLLSIWMQLLIHTVLMTVYHYDKSKGRNPKYKNILREKFIDHDIGPKRTFIITSLFVLLMLNGQAQVVDWTLALSIAIVAGTIVVQPGEFRPNLKFPKTPLHQ